MDIKPYQKRTWAEIDLNAVEHNYKEIKKCVKNAKVCCVIKANGYGHGALELARCYEKFGADFFAVSNIEEAIQLRQGGIDTPILVLGYTEPTCAKILAEYSISQCVFSSEYGKSLVYHCTKDRVKVKVHIKIDTGMGRIGFKFGHETTDDLQDAIEICKSECFILEGIFTHFASADEGKKGDRYTRYQFQNFIAAINIFKSKGIQFEIRHCANSAAIVEYPYMHLDMVRAGIVLYGVHPSQVTKNKLNLMPVMKVKTVIDYIKIVEKKTCISYGRKFKARKTTKIATLPIGYADGFWRANGLNRACVEIGGEYAPIIGRVCMDQCMVDVTNVGAAVESSVVTVYGAFGKNSVDAIASKNDTINYEILCAVGNRVPRIYFKNGKIVSVTDNIVTKI